MDTKKKEQVITLILTVIILIAAAGGIYVFTGARKADIEQQFTTTEPVSSPVKQPSADLDTAPVEQENKAEEETQMQTQTSSVNDNFVRLDGGTFPMGSPDSERQRGKDEASHEVTLSPFYVDAYEVTQVDYAAVMGENPSCFDGGRLPVENVTWYDAVEYCNRLSETKNLTPAYTIEGKTVRWDRSANGYRLLTEAEWEYAARAGTDTIYHFGNQVHSDFANFEGSYPYLIEENYVSRKDASVVTSKNRGTTIEVDALSPNAFGLYHMHGNVAEWCFDYYGEYDMTDTENPSGAANGSLRVNRGGSYNDFGKHLRSAYRSVANPMDADQNLGFRICRNAEPLQETVETTYALDITIPKNPKILIAYFSYSGNTENAAKILQEKTGADLFEITMEHPYHGNIYDVSQYDLMHEIRPALSAHVENMAQYDVILLGYPTWHGDTPMAIRTFLEEYDFTGKKVIPFCSSGSSSPNTSFAHVKESAKGADVLDGFWTASSGLGRINETVPAWLDGLGISWEEKSEETEGNTMKITVGNTVFTAALAENSSVTALKELLAEEPLTIHMHDYGDMEKVGPIGTSLPRNDEQITTGAGDIILYQGNSLVIYYDTNSWNFTRIGKIENVTKQELLKALGDGDVDVTFSLE